MPPELGRIVRHSLAKDPAQRYQTAIDVRNELAELQQDLSSGSLQAPAGAADRCGSIGSIGIYSFATGRYTRVYDSDSANSPIWLNDGRRLLVQERPRVLLATSRRTPSAS